MYLVNHLHLPSRHALSLSNPFIYTVSETLRKGQASMLLPLRVLNRCLSRALTQSVSFCAACIPDVQLGAGRTAFLR